MQKLTNDASFVVCEAPASATRERAFSGVVAARQREQIYKPNFVRRFQISNLQIEGLKSEIEVAIIPLARTLPAGSSDLPEGRSNSEISDLKFET